MNVTTSLALLPELVARKRNWTGSVSLSNHLPLQTPETKAALGTIHRDSENFKQNFNNQLNRHDNYVGD